MTVLTTKKNKHPICLGIETSCDDTSVAIADKKKVYSNIVSSQHLLHSDFGGVVPELASREHLKQIETIFKMAIDNARVTPKEIDFFSVTYGPGLAGALSVGLNFVKGLSLRFSKPFIGIHHIEGHIASNYIETDWAPPYLALIVSGGHTLLVHVKDWLYFCIIGTSIDDAIGEAFDKTAKSMGLSYPGGPEVEKLAKKGNPYAIEFPIPYIKNNTLNFSYSGLKTSVVNYLNRTKNPYLPDVCASFQRVAVSSLLIKLKQASEKLKLKRIAISGGVSANSFLRKEITALKSEHFEIHCPSLSYCTDNAAMIVKAALIRYEKSRRFSPLDLKACPVLTLEKVNYNDG